MKTYAVLFNSFLAKGDFWHLLITFANSLDSDQDGQKVIGLLAFEKKTFKGLLPNMGMATIFVM